MELISVIVPIYNMESYLEACLDSILSQTYENIEIILIDDGSTDASGSICDAYAKKDKRVIVIHKINGGVGAARNSGLELASGEYIAFADPDDYLTADCLSSLYDVMDSTVQIVCGCCYSFDENMSVETHFFNGDREFSNADKKDLFLQLFFNEYGQPARDLAYTAIGVPWAKLYRKDFIEHHGLRFPADLRRMQDNVFNMYAFQYADKIKYIDTPLYNYRLEHINVVNSLRYDANFDSVYSKITEARKRFLYEFSIIDDKELMDAFIKDSFFRIIDTSRKCIFHRDNGASLRDKRSSFKRLVLRETNREVIEKIDIASLKSLKVRVFAVLLKLKQYHIAGVIFSHITKC